jgi:ankyrin repeat protein
VHVKMILHGVMLTSLVSLGSLAVADPLHDAVASGDVQQVEALVRQGAFIDARDMDGRTPLNLAVERENILIARYLIEHGAKVNLADYKNRSPLHSAAEKGNVDIARLLLDVGATTINDTTIAERGGFLGVWTPLHLACAGGYTELAGVLLDRGADIEARDGIQRTPLILSAGIGDVRVGELLLEHGADINAEAIRGYTALLWGARNRSEDFVDMLVRHGVAIAPEALPQTFQMAVVTGMKGLYDYVLSLGLDVSDMIRRDPGLIFPAAASGSPEIVQSLIELGFDPLQTDPSGWTPLHYAVSEWQVDVLGVLVEKGVDINARNMKGESAYDLAVVQGANEVSDYLKVKGADTSGPLFPVLEGPYMGQQPSGNDPVIFLPGIVSGHDRAHSSIAFSPDGTEAYWTEMIPPEGRVAVMRLVNGRWTYPVAADLDRDPSFSPDGKRLYFIRTRPFREGEVPGGDPDVKEEYWYREKTDAGWSDPRSVGDAVNKLGVHWPCSVDKEGNLYFSEFADSMYVSRLIDGVYQKPVSLREYLGNESFVGRSPFMSPEGDYLLFSSDEGLCIAFKKLDGSWTDRISLGDTINASHENGSPRITPDGKYMFFLSAGNGRPWGIYWVSTSFIYRLKQEHLAEE